MMVKKTTSKKKKILLITLSFIVFIIFIIMCYSLIRRTIIKKNDSKINKSITEAMSIKEDYVFVEINPKLVLIVNNGKIQSVHCMNHDCMNFYDDIKVKHLGVMDGINEIYLLAQKKGFDTTHGVKIKSTTYIPVNDNFNYIEVEYIKEKTKDKLIKEVINNKPDNTSNNNYYNDLWDKLKEDDDYDKYYTCDMENNELTCHFIMNAIESKFDLESIDVLDIDSLFSNKNIVLRILKKFNFKVSNDFVSINDKSYKYSISFTHNGTKYGNILYRELIEKLPDELCSYNENNCYLNDGVELFRIDSINLLNPILTNDSLINISYGLKDNIVKNYELINGYETDFEKRKEKYKQEQIAAGYHLEEKQYCDENGCITEKMWCLPEDVNFNGMYGYCHGSEYEY